MMEFKLRYLNQYATLLENYFSNLNFSDIITEIDASEQRDAGRKLAFLVCYIISSGSLGGVEDASGVTEEMMDEACNDMGTDEFKEKFFDACQLDTMP